MFRRYSFPRLALDPQISYPPNDRACAPNSGDNLTQAMTAISFFQQVVINQLLGIRGTRRAVESLVSRPRLAPTNREPADIWSDPFHPELPLRKFRRIQTILGEASCCSDKVVVEIGPGMSLGMGIVGVALGACRCILVDQEQHVTQNPRTSSSHQDLLNLIPSWIPNPDPRYLRCVKICTDTFLPDQDSLAYLMATAQSIPLRDESAHLLVSHSTLEHIRNLDAAVSEFARVTIPGGRGVHQADLTDHLTPTEPLRMLYYPSWAWELLASNRHGWTNRLRLCAYVRCFERHGFVIEKLEVTRALSYEEVARVSPRLHQDYKYLPQEDLAPLGFICVLRKR